MKPHLGFDTYMQSVLISSLFQWGLGGKFLVIGVHHGATVSIHNHIVFSMISEMQKNNIRIYIYICEFNSCDLFVFLGPQYSYIVSPVQKNT